MVHYGTFTHPFTEQVKAYHRLQEELESAYMGRWVIISDLQCVGDYGSFEDADAAMKEME